MVFLDSEIESKSKGQAQCKADRIYDRDGFDFSEYVKEGFDSSRLLELSDIAKKVGDIKPYVNKDFSWEQLNAMFKLLPEAKDIIKYVNPNFSPEQIVEIGEGLKYGINVELYADVKFNPAQMKVIRTALKCGVSKDMHINSSVSEEEMQKELQQLLGNLDADIDSVKDRYTVAQKTELRKGLRAYVDISLFNNPEYSPEEMRVIRRVLIDTYKISTIALDDYSIEQIEMLGVCAADVDIDSWVNPGYSPEQMKICRDILKIDNEAVKYLDCSLSTGNLECLLEFVSFGFDLNKYTGQKDNLKEGYLRQAKKEHGIDLHADSYTPYEFEFIRRGMKHEYNVACLFDYKWGLDKIKQIIFGLEHGLDVGIYATPDFSEEEMVAYRWALEHNINLNRCRKITSDKHEIAVLLQYYRLGADDSDYLSKEFSVEQLREIVYGKLDGLDTDKYAKSQYSPYIMQIMRYGLICNIDMSPYIYLDSYGADLDIILSALMRGYDSKYFTQPEFRDDQRKEIIDGLDDGIDVSSYADPRFDNKQMYELHRALRKGLDVSNYADPRFDDKQLEFIIDEQDCGKDISKILNPKLEVSIMEKIQEGLSEDIDLSPYVEMGMDFLQLCAVLTGLEKGLDPKYYANPEFNYKQMECIITGLEHNIDVSSYANPELNCYEMEERRKELEANTKVSIPVKPHENKDVLERLFDKGVEALKERFVSPYEEAVSRSKGSIYERVMFAWDLGYDISSCGNGQYGTEQLEIIIDLVENGIDASEFSDNIYTTEQLNTIREYSKRNPEIMNYITPEFSPGQIEQIGEGLWIRLNVQPYADARYSVEHMKVFRWALQNLFRSYNYSYPEHSIDDVKKDYSNEYEEQRRFIKNNEKFSSEVKEILLDALNNYHALSGYDWLLDYPEKLKAYSKLISVNFSAHYMDTDYWSPEQLYELAKCTKRVDIKDWARYNMSAKNLNIYSRIAEIDVEMVKNIYGHFSDNDMKKAWEYAKFGIDPTKYCEYNISLEHLKQAKLDVGIDADAEFSPEEIKVIRKGVLEGFNVSPYADGSFDEERMKQILLGMEHGVDVSVYADRRFTSEEMVAYRWALENDINLKECREIVKDDHELARLLQFRRLGFNDTDYLSGIYDKYKYGQLLQIALGRLDGVDTDKYTNSKCDWMMMCQIRLGLVRDAYMSTNTDKQ